MTKTKIDWTKKIVYVTPEPLRPTWWERGVLRYGCLSYGLWLRTGYYDVVHGKPVPKKKVK